MSDNLPAIRPTSREVARQDTDSWTDVFQDVVELSRGIASTEFVPKSLRNNIPATTAAILYGREVGLGPMTSLTQTHVIEGKPAMSAEAMRALVFASGHELVIEESTGAICRMRGRRAGSEHWTTIEWSIDMARAAGVTGKQVWKSYPRQMLQARATTELCRLVFPDVIHGFRSIEELDDAGAVESDAVQAAPAEPSTKVTRKRAARKAPASKPAPTADRPAQPPAMDGPPLPGEPGYEEGEASTPDEPAAVAPDSVGGSDDGSTASHAEDTGNDDEDPPTDDIHDAEIVEEQTVEEGTDTEPEPEVDGDEEPPPPRAASRAQHRLLFVLLDKLGVGEDERHVIVSFLLGRQIESFNHLTFPEAKTLLDTLPRIKDRAELDALIENDEIQP